MQCCPSSKVSKLVNSFTTIRDRTSMNMSLHDAVESGALDIVKTLIANGADINELGDRNRTPLHVAIRKGYDDIATYLIDNDFIKADVNAVASNGETPLHVACDKVAVEVARLLLKRGANPNAQLNHLNPKEGLTPLMQAVPSPYELTVNKRKKSELLAMFKMLLDHGCDLNVQDCRGNTALHRAADFGDAHAVAMLADYGADLHVENTFGLTAFQMAVGPDIQKYEVAIYLLLYGYVADASKEEMFRVFNCLHCGQTTKGFPERDPLRSLLFRLLMEDLNTGGKQFVNVENVNQEFFQPSTFFNPWNNGSLTESLQRQCRRVVRRRIRRSMYRNIADLPIAPSLKRYLTLSVPNPLKMCELNLEIKEGDVSHIGQLLCDSTIEDVNFNLNKRTPLTLAASVGHLGALRILVDHGAKLEVLDNAGSTALHEAANNGYLEIVQFFIKRGIDVNLENINAECALVKAAENGHFGIVIYLLQSVCKVTNLINRDGYSALHFAAGSGAFEAVRVLLTRGVSPNVSDGDGNTPLHVAASCGAIYLNKGMELLPALFRTNDSMMYEGLRAVMGLTARADLTADHAGVVRLLLGTGADKSLLNGDGKTAEQLARGCQKDNGTILELLLG